MMAVFYFGDRPIAPREYAHLAVRAAHQVATGALQNFHEPSSRTSSLANSIVIRIIPAYLQYVALGIASYWFYAVIILHAKESVQSEMIEGLKEGLLEHLSIAGEPMAPAFRLDLPADIEEYMKALIYDYNHPTETGISNPDVCAVGKLHKEKMGKYYDPFISQEDRLNLV